jgi:hypothetical protein
MPLQDRPCETMLDHFASGIARLDDIRRAAAALGRSEAWGKKQFARLCADLGEPVDSQAGGEAQGSNAA